MKQTRQTRHTSNRHDAGVTLVELMVSLAIGSFLMIGALQIYSQSRQAYVINDSIARVQETAQFAMDTIEADLRMASNFGRSSRSDSIEGRSIAGNANPDGLTIDGACGAVWILNLAQPVEGTNSYALPCAPTGAGGAQPNSDTITIRRATVLPTNLVPGEGRLQIQSTRLQGQIFDDGVRPVAFGAPPLSETHDLLVNTYYVAASSTLIPGVPTLRRKTLGVSGGAPQITDIEVAPGVENLQLQFGVDMDGDNTVDRYVNPGDPVIDPTVGTAGGWVPTARVLTVRIWLVVRSISIETGIVDLTDYEPGDVDLGVPNDLFRRLMVSKTILLRNTRT